MRPANQVVPMKVATSRTMLRMSCHAGALPMATRTIITTGLVNGIKLHQKTIGLPGFYTAVCAMMMANIMGMVTGNMNCCVSDSLSTAEPIAASMEL